MEPKYLWGRPLISLKVQIFWEGHKILRNINQLFILCTASQILVEISQKFAAFSEYMNFTPMQFCEVHHIFFLIFFYIFRLVYNEFIRCFQQSRIPNLRFFIEYVLIYFSTVKQKAFSTGQTLKILWKKLVKTSDEFMM